MSTADAKESRRERRASRGPGPFDPDAEFRYDPGRSGRNGEHDRELSAHAVGPGPFDPDLVLEPRPEPAPERAPELEPEPEPAGVPEPQSASEPAPEPPSLPAASEPQPIGDSLDPAPWVPSDPLRAARQRSRRLPRRRPRVRVPALLGFALVATLATGVASVAGGLPLGPLSPESKARNSAGAAALSGGEEASSQAITSESGPLHPVAVDGPVDYGDSGARFGASRYGHGHEGQDMFARSGTPLVAVRDGVVIDEGNDGGRGNYVAIYSEPEDQTYVYMHMLRPTPLESGGQVAAGKQVGAMGCTGSCYGTHLHFEVRVGKGIDREPIDPLPLLKRWPQLP